MKILMVTTISNTVNLFLIPHIKLLIEEGHTVDVAFNIVQEVMPDVIELGCKIHVLPFQRSPLDLGNFKAAKLLKRIIADGKYDIVHTHTPIASAVTRLVCKNLKNVVVLYTAHGFHFYKGAPLLNWIIYYPIEKWLARYTDVLITINKFDYNLARNKFKAKRIEYIPGIGVKLDNIQNEDYLRENRSSTFNIPENSYVLLSVGELNKNKNHENVIKAISKINDSKIHYFICGEGKLKDHLIKKIKDLKLENNVHLLGFRKDIKEIMKISDLFIFPSYREGLSVALMEAMATGIPIICSNIRGNTDLIIDEVGGVLVDPDNYIGFAEAITRILESEEIKNKFINANLEKVKEFAFENIFDEINKLYIEIDEEN